MVGKAEIETGGVSKRNAPTNHPKPAKPASFDLRALLMSRSNEVREARGRFSQSQTRGISGNAWIGDAWIGDVRRRSSLVKLSMMPPPPPQLVRVVLDGGVVSVQGVSHTTYSGEAKWEEVHSGSLLRFYPPGPGKEEARIDIVENEELSRVRPSAEKLVQFLNSATTAKKTWEGKYGGSHMKITVWNEKHGKELQTVIDTYEMRNDIPYQMLKKQPLVSAEVKKNTKETVLLKLVEEVYLSGDKLTGLSQLFAKHK